MASGFKEAARPDQLGHRERLRQRFRDAGADALPVCASQWLLPEKVIGQIQNLCLPFGFCSPQLCCFIC